MIILEYIVLQIFLVVWFVYIVKNYPKETNAYSYKIYVGNIGAIILMTILAIWNVANNQSFFTNLWESINK